MRDKKTFSDYIDWKLIPHGGKKVIWKLPGLQTIELLFTVLFSEHFCLHDSVWSSWWQHKEVGIIWSSLFKDEKQNKTEQILWEVILSRYKQVKA